MKKIVELVELEEQHQRAVTAAEKSGGEKIVQIEEKSKKESEKITAQIQKKDQVIGDAVQEKIQAMNTEVSKGAQKEASVDVAAVEKIIIDHLV